MVFPDRTTAIGKVIDTYLKSGQDLDDAAIHLLFSANRWEVVKTIKDKIAAGETLVLDRYCFSGAAFSAAKETHTLEWCKGPDRGLPKPDIVCYLDVSAVNTIANPYINSSPPRPFVIVLKKVRMSFIRRGGGRNAGEKGRSMRLVSGRAVAVTPVALLVTGCVAAGCCEAARWLRRGEVRD